MAAVLISLAVGVCRPAVLSVTLNVFVPETSAAFPGMAPRSVEVSPTASVELTTFQAASTAFTVTVNGAPAGCAFGLPVFPLPLLAVPGAAVPPGRGGCSFTNVPAFSVFGESVCGFLVPSVISVAAGLLFGPAVISVTLNVCVPDDNARFPGIVAFVSVEVIPTVSAGAEVTTYQFASTAFTVTVNAVPAVTFGVPVFPLAVPGAAVSPGIKSGSFGNGGRRAMLIRPWSDEKPSVADVGP